jgi:Leucine-rich repeat (LRR) protein
MWKLIVLTLLITAKFSLAQQEALCVFDREMCVFSSLEIEEDEIVIFGVAKPNITSNVRRISFRNSSIFGVPKELFSVFSNLVILEMVGQKIQILATGTFLNATGGLDVLALHRNNIRELPSHAFNGPSFMRYLYLHENKIEILNFDCFKGLSQLEILKLENNNLDIFPRNVFKDLIKLKEINLMDNKLEFLPKRLFETNKILRNVILQGNPMKAVIPTMFSHLSNLNVLDLSGANCVNKTFSTWANIDFEKVEKALEKCSISEFFLNKYDDIKLEIQTRIQDFTHKLEKIMELSRTFI